VEVLTTGIDNNSILINNDVRFVFTSGLFTLFVFVLRIVVSNTCVVFLFCFSSSCVPYVASFSSSCVPYVASFSSSCVPYVDSFSGLCCVFVFFFFILCTLCCQFLWVVLCFCFVFLRPVYPMLTVSLDFSFSIASSVFSNVFFLYKLDY
jgi:hypothetical protein